MREGVLQSLEIGPNQVAYPFQARPASQIPAIRRLWRPPGLRPFLTFSDPGP